MSKKITRTAAVGARGEAPHRTHTEEGEAMAAVVARGLNQMSHNEFNAGFITIMGQEHRTIQQGFTRLVHCWLEHLAKAYARGEYDARNEAACLFAAQALQRCDRTAFPFI
jgi:hypothetical protein